MTPRPAHARRRPAARLAYAAGALAAALVAAELWLRATGYDPLAELREVAAVGAPFLRPSDDPRLRYEPTPGAAVPGFGGTVAINAHGFRGPDVAPRPAPGVLRIAALGDSVTFGVEVAAEETWPARLEARLRAAGRRCEALNLGVPGYDTLQEAAFLERVGLDFAPDLVLVGYCVNDLGTQSVERSHLERARRLTSWPYRSRLYTWVQLTRDRWQLEQGYYERNEDARFLHDNPGTIAALDGDAELLGRLAELRARLARLEPPVQVHEPLAWYASEAHVGRLRFALEELARVAGAAPVVVAVIPYLREDGRVAEYDRAYALVEREARRAGLAVVQLAPALRGAPPAELRAYPEDALHLNARGHDRVAAALVRALQEQDLLPR